MTQESNLRREVAQFQAPILHKSLSQLTTSFGGFFATCAAMYAVTDVSYWMALALAPLAAGFLVRIFIIQHDCGHLSFFRSRRANDIAGFACSLLTLTPYASWRRQHVGHHGVWNDLDRRQSGADIYSSCLTVAEYRALSPRQRWWYRATRHPLVANVLLPPLIFTLLYRLPFDMPRSWRRERRMVHLTTLALVAVLGGLGHRLNVSMPGEVFRRRLRTTGIRDRPTAPRSPWQNGLVERLIGSIRRECLDHMVNLGEAHLRRALRAYAEYYNGTRTHLSLSKDTPVPRAIRRDGRIRSVPHLGGLHHSSVRI